jgi:L-histidine Nalpha-methyltransferase / hercynylcysteine S-oxide synthase
MLLQVADGSAQGTQPPPGYTTPSWKLLAEADAKMVAKFEGLPTNVTLGPTSFSLGHNDKDTEDINISFNPTHDFGWDNESPARQVEVAQFKIEWRPVSNGQFYNYFKTLGTKGTFPKSWVEVDGDIYVRTLYGLVSMEYAYHWPVIASYDDMSTYARVQGGRIPTEPELRLFYDTFCNGYLGGMNIGFRNWHPIA